MQETPNESQPATFALDAPPVVALIDSLGGTEPLADGDWIDFAAGDVWVVVNQVKAIDRLRIRVYLPRDDEQLVKEWVDQQPQPVSGLLQPSYLDEGEWRPRLVFERPHDHTDWPTDPIHADIARYKEAWAADVGVEYSRKGRPSYAVPRDPIELAPASAWLLKGDEASFPTPEELRRDREAAKVGIFTWEWTTAAQTRAGDLVLFYFLSPRKAVHFVARAASDAFFTRDLEVNANGRVNSAQWWAYFTNPIEIEPIGVDVLRQAVGGYLPLRGRSGLYLRPETIATLPIRAVEPADQEELERVITVPVGLPTLPDPLDIGRATWRGLAAGAFPLEEHVSSHIVEPLLRDILADTGLTWRPQFRIDKRVVDYVVLDGERPVHVIEVKKVIKQGQQGWAASPDFAQVCWYANRLGVPSTLIDSHRVLLIEPGAAAPAGEIDRRGSTDEDHAMIRAHLLSNR